MSIYKGFEGHRTPSLEEVQELLSSVTIVLDTNVLLDIYGYEEPSRNLALASLESVKERLWVPHQVMREFWRNRHNAIAKIEVPTQLTLGVREELFKIINDLRPDTVRTQDLDEIRDTVEKQLGDLETAISEARGEQLDVDRILKDSSSDPVLAKLESILEGRVGDPFDSEEEMEMVALGRRRFEEGRPPGYEDGEDKEDQLPERGTGDFLLWEQTLRYIEAEGQRGFVLVTNDKKQDWRVVLKQPKRELGVRPELVDEAIERTGFGFVSMLTPDFYRLVTASSETGVDSASESLVAASAQRSKPAGGDDWSRETYDLLLDGLLLSGNVDQATAILRAARNGGFVERATIYEDAGFDQLRTLNRFAYPATLAAARLIDQGVLTSAAQNPLEAVYEPGSTRTSGYQVPPEFVRFETDMQRSLTWVEAAVEVASQNPDHEWTVRELVEEIERQGLRDLSNAATPEATLRRDLVNRGGHPLRRTEDGRFTLRDEEPPQAGISSK